MRPSCVTHSLCIGNDPVSNIHQLTRSPDPLLADTAMAPQNYPWDLPSTYFATHSLALLFKWLGSRRDDVGFVSRKGQSFVSSRKRPDWLWGPKSFLLNGHRGSLPTANLLGGEVDQSPLSPSLRMGGSVPLLPSNAFVTWAGRNWFFFPLFVIGCHLFQYTIMCSHRVCQFYAWSGRNFVTQNTIHIQNVIHF